MDQASFKAMPESFEEIYEAVMETARGRWFLTEFARRNQAADTERILSELHRLQAPVMSAQESLLSEELKALAQAVTSALDEHNTLKSAVSNPSSQIEACAQRIRAIAGELRLAHGDWHVCDRLEDEIDGMFRVGAGHGIAPGRSEEFATTLHHLKERITAILETLTGETQHESSSLGEALLASQLDSTVAEVAEAPGREISISDIDEILMSPALPELDDLIITDTRSQPDPQTLSSTQIELCPPAHAGPDELDSLLD